MSKFRPDNWLASIEPRPALNMEFGAAPSLSIFVTLKKNPCSKKKNPDRRTDGGAPNSTLGRIEVEYLETPYQTETCPYKSVLDQKLALVRSRRLHQVAAPILNIFKINHMKNCTNQF